MKTKLQISTCLLGAVSMLLSACGIEVGNPHGKKDTTTPTSLVINLADAPVDELKHVYLNITGLTILQNSGTSVPLQLKASGKIDALALQDGKSLSLGSGESLPVGDYGAVVLDLDADAPASTVGEDGEEHAVDFADGSHAIFVQQAFSVAEGDALDLMLHIDLRRSLSRLTGPDERRFKFGPLATLLPSDTESMVKGTIADNRVSSVCAYLRRRPDFVPGERFPEGGPMMPRQSRDGAPPPPPAGSFPGRPPHAAPAKLPPSFSPDEDKFPGDGDDASCSNAFATASVREQSYTLSHLWPGEYQLRFLDSDGKTLEPAELNPQVDPTALKFKLEPGQILEVSR